MNTNTPQTNQEIVTDMLRALYGANPNVTHKELLNLMRELRPKYLQALQAKDTTCEARIAEAVGAERERMIKVLDAEFYGIPQGKTRFYNAEDANEAIRNVYQALTPLQEEENDDL